MEFKRLDSRGGDQDSGEVCRDSRTNIRGRDVRAAIIGVCFRTAAGLPLKTPWDGRSRMLRGKAETLRYRQRQWAELKGQRSKNVWPRSCLWLTTECVCAQHLSNLLPTERTYSLSAFVPHLTAAPQTTFTNSTSILKALPKRWAIYPFPLMDGGTEGFLEV